MSGIDWELGINGCKLLILEWVNNEILKQTNKQTNKKTMRFYCVALRTMTRYLPRSMIMGEKYVYTYMCNWVRRLYSWKKICVGEITMKNKIR